MCVGVREEENVGAVGTQMASGAASPLSTQLVSTHKHLVAPLVPFGCAWGLVQVVHSTPAEPLKVPPGHGRQSVPLVEPAALDVPAAHAVHAAAPAPLKKPAGHWLHDSAPAPGAKKPAAQPRQAPPANDDPAGHIVAVADGDTVGLAEAVAEDAGEAELDSVTAADADADAEALAEALALATWELDA